MARLTLRGGVWSTSEDDAAPMVSLSLQPVDETPVDETPVDETPVDETPADQTPVKPRAKPKKA